MKIISQLLTILLLLTTWGSYAGTLTAPVAKGEVSPYWWTLLVIPGFVILWISKKRKM